jgi:hypothetical protein
MELGVNVSIEGLKIKSGEEGVKVTLVLGTIFTRMGNGSDLTPTHKAGMYQTAGPIKEPVITVSGIVPGVA